MLSQPSVGVIGGGSWGTALAIAAQRAGSKALLATRNKNVVESIRSQRVNEVYLPNVFVDPAIDVSDDFTAACKGDVLIIASPSSQLRSVCIAISDSISHQIPIALGTKGIERGSLLLMSEVVKSVLPKNPVVVISGPNFAAEVARGKPSATTIACVEKETARLVASAIGSLYFRPYLSTDVIGAQISGAVKNVIAIACGIAIGRDLGENAKAALITRGFAEMSRLCLAKGGKQPTLMGLSGLGDLVLTASSTQSRNTAYGIALSRQTPLGQLVVSEGRGVVEGYTSAESVVKLAEKHHVDMPICKAVHAIINQNASVDEVMKQLMERPLADE